MVAFSIAATTQTLCRNELGAVMQRPSYRSGLRLRLVSFSSPNQEFKLLTGLCDSAAQRQLASYWQRCHVPHCSARA